MTVNQKNQVTEICHNHTYIKFKVDACETIYIFFRESLNGGVNIAGLII